MFVNLSKLLSFCWRSMAYSKHAATNTTLRLLAGGVTLAAALITVLAKENRWGIEASYKTFDALKFFVAANFIACAYSFLTAPAPFVPRLLGSFTLHLFDLMSMSLLMAAATAAATIGYIGEKGNHYTGWYEVCRLYHHFCCMTGISLCLCFLGCFFSFAICALSYYHRAVLKN